MTTNKINKFKTKKIIEKKVIDQPTVHQLSSYNEAGYQFEHVNLGGLVTSRPKQTELTFFTYD